MRSIFHQSRPLGYFRPSNDFLPRPRNGLKNGLVELGQNDVGPISELPLFEACSVVHWIDHPDYFRWGWHIIQDLINCHMKVYMWYEGSEDCDVIHSHLENTFQASLVFGDPFLFLGGGIGYLFQLLDSNQPQSKTDHQNVLWFGIIWYFRLLSQKRKNFVPQIVN